MTKIDLTFSYKKLPPKLLEFVRKSNHFTTFVNATNIKSCFSMTTFYIDFFHYQLHQIRQLLAM